MKALQAQFGEAAEFDDPEGGIFLWVKLPDAVNTTRLVQGALEAGVSFNPGAEWVTGKELGRQHLRLCFAHPSEETIAEGISRLAEVCYREFGVPNRGGRPHR
jgi:2-aminoadipate transaminase